MSDFFSVFWKFWITTLTLGGIAFCLVLLINMSKRPSASGHAAGEQTGEPMGHVWDEDLQELNNPLPTWWLRLFYISIIFGLGYLVLYPGLGSYAGYLNWTSRGAYVQEKQSADLEIKPIFDRFAQMDITEIAKDPEARLIGQRLFINHCAQCHGSDGGGQRGYPNLKDNDWLWGGEPASIEQTIREGRQAQMPAWGTVYGEEGVKQLAHYVLSLSRPVNGDDAALAAKGAPLFATTCAACHGAEGKGNPVMGAPNLTDHIWLYGGTEKEVMETIRHGRHGVMPAHKDRLSSAHIRVLAGYVYGFSH